MEYNDKMRLLEELTVRIMMNTSVKTKDAALEIARRWVG